MVWCPQIRGKVVVWCCSAIGRIIGFTLSERLMLGTGSTNVICDSLGGQICVSPAICVSLTVHFPCFVMGRPVAYVCFLLPGSDHTF